MVDGKVYHKPNNEMVQQKNKIGAKRHQSHAEDYF